MSHTWTLWGTSREISSARPLPVTVDERHLVVWRTPTGALSLLDGSCRHLGASLGHVGRIVDGCVRCPFHGWTYDPDGTNVEQPGMPRTGRTRSNAALGSYGAAEEAGLVLVSTTRAAPTGDPAADEVRAALADALGLHESMGGAAVTGATQRWVIRHPESTSPGGREVVEWLLAGRDGDRPVPGTDPGWDVLRPGVRVERSRGPLSGLNGLHATAPRVRFLRMGTDPVLEIRTVGGGIHVARVQPHPATLRLQPARRHDALALAALRGARLVASISALTPTTLAVTAVAVHPDRRGLGPAIAAAGDLVLRRRIGRRLALLAGTLDAARIAGPAAFGDRTCTPGNELPRNGAVTDDRPRARTSS